MNKLNGTMINATKPRRLFTEGCTADPISINASIGIPNALPYAGSRRNSVSGFWSPSMVCGSMEGGGYDAILGKMPGDR